MPHPNYRFAIIIPPPPVSLALSCARVAGLNVPEEVFEDSRTFLDKMTAPKTFRVGYTSRGDSGSRLCEALEKFGPSEAMTASALIARIFMGTPREDPAVVGGAKLVSGCPPCWAPCKHILWAPYKGKVIRSTIDMYYWHFGTLALFQLGAEPWKRWNDFLMEALLPNQKTSGCECGSWDPVGAWGSAGGRVYATALNVLTLETVYRYGRTNR